MPTEPTAMISGDVMELHHLIYAEREAHAAEVAELHRLLATAKADLAAAREEIQRKDKALDSYGKHDMSCVRYRSFASAECTCGLDAARAGGGR